MDSRSRNWLTWLSLSFAVLLLLLATSVWFRMLSANPAFLLFGSAVMMLLVALLSSRVGRLSVEVLEQKDTRNELLHQELARQQRAVDQLADGLDIAIFLCEPKGTILYANRRAREMFRVDEPIGKSLLALTLSYELERLVVEAANTGETQQAELTFSFPGERVGLARAWFDGENDERVFLSIYEISQLRKLERIRQDFVANVSHELRTPMTLIRAMAETLLDDFPDDEEEESLGHRYLSKMIMEVDRLSSITQDLLILSAAESNPVRKQVCDLAEVVRNVTQELRVKAEEKGLGLCYLGPEEVILEANTSQMKQVALNLIENAIKYSLTGVVEVDILVQEADVVLQVQDTGIGIASEHIDRIFERFYRVDKGRSRATGGTGLGLSIVKHIVEAHGGTVSVQSRLNHGSTFSARLPVGSPQSLDQRSEVA